MRIQLMILATILVACGEEEVKSDIWELADLDGDGSFENEDCDDNDASIYPGADEVCDGIDNDCDGDTDNGAIDTQEFYIDTDDDGYGDSGSSIDQCEAPEGYVDNMDDCNDDDELSNPGADEVCDGMDNNCDGSIDEDLESMTSYEDTDGDGFGDSSSSIEECEIPEGYVDNWNDCNDEVVELGSSEDDLDCDGILNDEDEDADGDGFLAEEECDDSDPTIVQTINSPSVISTDSDGDGVVDTVQTYTYNMYGQESNLSELYDINGDDVSDEAFSVYTYNEDGKVSVVDVTHDYGMNGTIDLSYSYEVTYTSDGEPLTVIADGTRIDGSSFEYSQIWTYDSDGNLTSSLFEADWDLSGNGQSLESSVQSYTYDTDGNLLFESFDEYNEAGDAQYDGIPEEMNTTTYDADGNRLTLESVFDSNSDGVVDEIYFVTYTYNSDGLLEQYILDYDWDADGTADGLYTYNYLYTSDDLVEQIETIVEYYLPEYEVYNYTQVITYLYTQDGDLLVTEIDSNNDGVMDTVYTNTYNVDGQLTEEQTADGTFTYSYFSCDDLNQPE